ncbi:MAG TPA: hypothetical protein VFG04_02630 [Planctomycetaceae bacterium]|jgi:hypothetical protein|nr:hypothetical protein [Planctomycetaceae bacterium]
MKSISEVFHSRRQHELSGFAVYILADGPADGASPVSCIAFDSEQNVLRPALLVANVAVGDYELTVLLDVFGSLRATDFDLSGVIGGVRCVLDRFERKYLQVTGTPDPAVFRAEDRKKSMHFGRIE